MAQSFRTSLSTMKAECWNSCRSAALMLWCVILPQLNRTRSCLTRTTSIISFQTTSVTASSTGMRRRGFCITWLMLPLKSFLYWWTISHQLRLGNSVLTLLTQLAFSILTQQSHLWLPSTRNISKMVESWSPIKYKWTLCLKGTSE